MHEYIVLGSQVSKNRTIFSLRLPYTYSLAQFILLSFPNLCLVHVIWTERWMLKLVLNVKYLLLSFITAAEFYNLGRIQGIITQKRSFLVIYTTFRSDFHVGWKNQNKNSTLNSSFDALSKWHEPDKNERFLFVEYGVWNLCYKGSE